MPNEQTEIQNRLLKFLEENEVHSFRDESMAIPRQIFYSTTRQHLTEMEVTILDILVTQGKVKRSNIQIAIVYTAMKFHTPTKAESELISEHTSKVTASGLVHLGSKTTEYKSEYDPTLLEAFTTSSTSDSLRVQLHCPEFTSLCPKTGQPDFANIYIEYLPKGLCVESKSLKLYLFSFRNHGGFHEQCIEMIGNDLWKLLEPEYLYVRGEFMPRGGISIWPEYFKALRPGFENIPLRASK